MLPLCWSATFFALLVAVIADAVDLMCYALKFNLCIIAVVENFNHNEITRMKMINGISFR